MPCRRVATRSLDPALSRCRRQFQLKAGLFHERASRPVATCVRCAASARLVDSDSAAIAPAASTRRCKFQRFRDPDGPRQTDARASPIITALTTMSAAHEHAPGDRSCGRTGAGVDVGTGDDGRAGAPCVAFGSASAGQQHPASQETAQKRARKTVMQAASQARVQWVQPRWAGPREKDRLQTGPAR